MRAYFIILFFFVSSLYVAGSQLDDKAKIRSKENALSFFEDESLIELSVKTDFSALRECRDRTQKEYFPGEIIWYNGDDTVIIPMKIRTRGNFRLKYENCDFPPLRFKFKDKEVANTIFDGQDKLKLVTHCKDTCQNMQQSMLSEYLAYKMYNLLCDQSFRVRLARIKYSDIITGDEFTKFAFFIENKEQMAERLGVECIEMANLTHEQLQQEDIIRMSVFNYMIGNTDWSLPKLHNVAIVCKEKHSPPVAIPYDFDMSEFVSASYRDKHMVEEASHFSYLGKKVPKEVLEKVIEQFQNKKEDLIELILDFEYLDIEKKQQCLAVVDDFYKVINDKYSVRKVFVAQAIK